MKELINIQQKLKAPKSQYNTFGKYNYRSAEDILEAVKPLLTENNCYLNLSDQIKQIGDRYYIEVTATLTNSEGKSVSTTAFAREPEQKSGMDVAMLTGSCSSYARKYALNGLLCIDDNNDPDAIASIGMTATWKEDLQKAATVDAVKAVWLENPNRQHDKTFKDAVNKRKAELGKKQ